MEDNRIPKWAMLLPDGRDAFGFGGLALAVWAAWELGGWAAGAFVGGVGLYGLRKG
jgi:hypothetical protein